ncbi:MAG: hypothetical protein HY040_17750 [Planctomycetes bacterium]|nr:hypothetical protein [Planctomycetota bacterium]
MAPRFSLPGDWSDILDRIQRALTHADRLAQEREDAQIACLAVDGNAETRREVLDHLPRRSAELERRVQAVADDMAGVDSALAYAESRYQAYLASVNSLSGKLAHWLRK